MAQQYKITYLDGTVDEVMPSPRARIETEQVLGGLKMENAQHATFYLAWLSLKKAGKTALEFDPWLDSIYNVDEVEATEPRPTQPAQPADTSSS